MEEILLEEILLNIESKEIRYAHLKNGSLQDLIIERKKSRQLTGNIYRGKVISILHNIQSAFIDIGEGENSGFMHISDILENTQKFKEMFDMDFDFEPKNPPRKKKQNEGDISSLMKMDQPVLVQVVKEPIGNKGARLTSNLSIPGRYLVLLPNTPHRGVSRKIEDASARDRLKKLIRAFEMPQDMGLICRTASVNATTDILIDEAHDLLHLWQGIVDNFTKATKPTLLFQESNLINKAVMTGLDKGFGRILVDDYTTYINCKKLLDKYQNQHPLKIELYRDKAPMFERFNIEKEIDKALKRKIWLSSGGYLFFDKTEAMTTIDVNSGRSSQSTGSDVEESLVQINMEAANEIARQLRIRNIGGLIICDFIDMRLRKNQRRVLDRLKEAMKDDSAKCTILGMSEFGLIEMTRQRNRESLIQTIFTPCPYCQGNGMIKSDESISIEIERQIKKIIHQREQFAIKLICHPQLKKYLSISDMTHFKQMCESLHAHIECEADENLHLNDFYFISTTNGKKIEV